MQTEIQAIQSQQYELSREMELALGVKQKKKKTGLLRQFFMNENVRSPSEINYPMRVRFLVFLDNQEISARTKENYIRTFDNLKMNSVPDIGTVDPFHPKQRFFEDDAVFLLYAPNRKKAETFRKVVDKRDLVMDFSGIRSIIVKTQMKLILCEILNLEYEQRYRRTYLKPFQRLIDFVGKYNMTDLEQMERNEELQFSLYMNTETKWIRDNAGKLLEFCRRTLFMKSDCINWYANVWYLDRFELDSMRINPSNPVRSISFLDVENKKNRRLLQEYMRYALGVSDLAVSTCRNKVVFLGQFLQFLDRKNLDISDIDSHSIWEYVTTFAESQVKYTTYNRMVIEIQEFLNFLESKFQIHTHVSDMKQYLQKGFLEHNDRIVEADTIVAILSVLPTFPDYLQLMYLILLCTGIRKSEVCMLKMGSLSCEKQETWLRLHQQKARYEKVIPIPSELYQELLQYGKKNNRNKEDYLFQGAKHSAFHAATFSNMMIRECEAHGIRCGEYIFRAHDYRHLVATQMRDKGIAIQAIREFVGHQSENMTKQYLDNMEEHILKKQKEYLEKRGM